MLSQLQAAWRLVLAKLAEKGFLTEADLEQISAHTGIPREFLKLAFGDMLSRREGNVYAVDKAAARLLALLRLGNFKSEV